MKNLVIYFSKKRSYDQFYLSIKSNRKDLKEMKIFFNDRSNFLSNKSDDLLHLFRIEIKKVVFYFLGENVRDDCKFLFNKEFFIEKSGMEIELIVPMEENEINFIFFSFRDIFKPC